MDNPLVEVTKWFQVMDQNATVRQAYGVAVIFWPSGVRTILQYHSIAVITKKEEYMQRTRSAGVRDLIRQKEYNQSLSVSEFRRTVHPPGWFIKTDRRGHKQARKVRAIAFMHPSSYGGPVPIIGDRI
jgi:hypothetical protein